MSNLDSLDPVKLKIVFLKSATNRVEFKFNLFKSISHYKEKVISIDCKTIHHILYGVH